MTANTCTYFEWTIRHLHFSSYHMLNTYSIECEFDWWKNLCSNCEHI